LWDKEEGNKDRQARRNEMVQHLIAVVNSDQEVAIAVRE
jgi:hypothetical protein